MSWVTVIWSMVAGACLTLAAVYFSVWLSNRSAWPSFFFSSMAIGTTLIAVCELWMMRAVAPEEFVTAQRWAHVAIWVVVVSLVGFLRTFLRPVRSWPGWVVVALRTLALVLNFTTGQSLNIGSIAAIERIPFLGEAVSIAVSTPNPWMLVGNLSLVFLVGFIADASVAAWRREDKGAATLVGGSAIIFVLAGAGQSMLVYWAKLQMPITVSLFSLGVLLAMAYELSRELLRASRLVDELRESEERMVLAANAADLGIWVREFSGEGIWASPKLRELFGFTMSEPLDLDRLVLAVHVDDRDTVRQVLARAAAKEGGYQVEFRTVRPDGATRWISAQGRVDFDEEHRPVRTRGACSDITARKQSGEEMARLRQEIAHAGRVSVMGQLASALAHEINQPLGAILRNAEAAALLLDADRPDLAEFRAIIEDILADDQRAGSVIDRMRALLRHHVIEMAPLVLNEIVRDVAALVRPDAAARQIKLVVQIADDMPEVLGDRVHLQQVLLNLISNGMDSIDEAHGKVRQITVSAARDGDHCVQIVVSDTGAGIPVHLLEQVFGSFFTTKPAGMGMGLSISRSLVEAHGGRLWAENCTLGGARLRLALPVSAPTSDQVLR